MAGLDGAPSWPETGVVSLGDRHEWTPDNGRRDVTRSVMPAPISARARSRLFRVAAAVLGLLCGLGAVEILGRVALGFEPPPPWAQAFAREAGYELHPGEAYIYSSASGEFSTVVRHNSRGLRDVEHDLATLPGVFRVLLLGDSFAEAQEVPLEESFPRRLEGLLDETAPGPVRIEVVNAGHSGLGTIQEYLYYLHEGRRYHPDLVLLGVYLGNDLIDNHAPLARAWMRVRELEHPYLTPDGVLHQPGLSLHRRLLRWLRFHIYTANLAARVWSRGGRAARITVGFRPGEAPNVGPEAQRVPLGLYLPPDAVWQDAWVVTGRIVVDLKASVEADGARLAAFVIPDRRQLGGEAWEAALAELPAADRARADRDRPEHAMVDLLESAGVPTLDLLPRYRAAPAGLYFPCDGHLTVAGHAVTADALAAWLRTARLVPTQSPASGHPSADPGHDLDHPNRDSPFAVQAP